MRRIISVLATLVLACGLLLTSPGTASAAPHHHGTLPYPTGCGRNAVVISRQNMAGGTASVVYSRTCGTNWIEWYGPAIYTYKTLHAGGRWAGYEEDYTGWAYSKQAYAPGSTPIAGGITVSSPNGHWENWNFECQWTCSWRLVHSG